MLTASPGPTPKPERCFGHGAKSSTCMPHPPCLLSLGRLCRPFRGRRRPRLARISGCRSVVPPSLPLGIYLLGRGRYRAHCPLVFLPKSLLCSSSSSPSFSHTLMLDAMGHRSLGFRSSRAGLRPVVDGRGRHDASEGARVPGHCPLHWIRLPAAEACVGDCHLPPLPAGWVAAGGRSSTNIFFRFN